MARQYNYHTYMYKAIDADRADLKDSGKKLRASGIRWRTVGKNTHGHDIVFTGTKRSLVKAFGKEDKSNNIVYIKK